MSEDHIARGQNELRDVRRKSRHLFWAVGLFSLFVNALMLTGPLYMLNIYDRVLSSRSVETLVALSVLVVFLFAMMGILDYARGRIMARVGARFQAGLDRRVFGAMLKAKTSLRAPAEAATGLRDLEAVQRLMTSPAAMALFDLPWTPLFFLRNFHLPSVNGRRCDCWNSHLVAYRNCEQSDVTQALVGGQCCKDSVGRCWREGLSRK